MAANTNVNVACPECGTELGRSYGKDVYKHMIQCFHLPNVGVEQTRRNVESETPERKERILYLLNEMEGPRSFMSVAEEVN